MEHNSNLMVIESKNNSLQRLTEIINTNWPQIQISSCVHADYLKEKARSAIIEVSIPEHLDIIDVLHSKKIKVIAAVTNDTLIREVLMSHATGVIIPPYDQCQIQKTLQKVTDLATIKNIAKGVDNVITLQPPFKSKCIMVNTGEGFEVIRVNEIVRIDAERAYCHMYLSSGRKIVISKPLKEVETSLPQNIFFRCHVSHLVNINAIQAYRREDGGMLLLNDNSKVSITKAKKQEVMKMLM